MLYKFKMFVLIKILIYMKVNKLIFKTFVNKILCCKISFLNEKYISY